MSQHPRDDDSPFMGAVLSSVRDAFRVPPQDPDAPRDSFLWRWTKFLSLIVVPAVIVGGGFVVEEYVMMSQGETSQRRELAADRVRGESVESARQRFLLGAAIGGGLGAVQVVRCLIRRVDP